MLTKEKILLGRKAVDAYRKAHRQLHASSWHKGISEDHTPLLKKLVAALEKLGITSTEVDFAPRKTEILAKFWSESDSMNIKELGFADQADFEKRAKDADCEAFVIKWQ